MFLNIKSSISYRYMFRLSLLLVFALWAFQANGQKSLSQLEAKYYDISTLPIPEGEIVEVGGLAFDDDGNLGVTTRRGELWLIANPETQQPKFSRFAHGLHEPLGLAWKDGAFFLNQRGELSKVQDTDGNGKADLYEPITRWDLTGNYHEYSYGPKFLPDGDMLVTLNLSWVGRGASLSKWRGWMMKVKEDGTVIPFATGMRSPSGFGWNADGDIFYAENQGDWVGSGRVTHMELGDFAGHPEGLKWSGEKGSPIALKMEDIDDTKGVSLYNYQEIYPEVKAPAFWFPHTIMGIATSDILLIESNDQVGPYKGQLLIGDQGHSKIMRVYQEKVNGVIQGAVIGFREGFASGVLRMIWGPDKKTMYVGMTSRGWRATGEAPYSIQRLNWNDKTPFEMREIRVQSDGFEIEFTEPVNRASAADPSSYSIQDFTYKYHHVYGSPPVEQEVRTIYKVELSQDGKTARLYVEGMRPGYVYEIKVPGVRSAGSASLLHNTAYYTLNQIPGGGQAHEGHNASAAPTSEQIQASSGKFVSPKYVNTMPDSWGKPDAELIISTVPGLKFDKEKLTVKAGAKVKLSFNNNDDMLHNLLIVEPGASNKVGQAAMQLGLDGDRLAYVPDMEEVLSHTALLLPESEDAIYFTAPSKPGLYEYVCTFPGHYLTMRGILEVK